MERQKNLRSRNIKDFLLGCMICYSYSYHDNIEYFIIGNKQELNKLCTSLIKFEITVEDILLESQNPQEIQESQITNLKPSDSERKTYVKKKTAKVKLLLELISVNIRMHHCCRITVRRTKHLQPLPRAQPLLRKIN